MEEAYDVRAVYDSSPRNSAPPSTFASPQSLGARTVVRPAIHRSTSKSAHRVPVYDSTPKATTSASSPHNSRSMMSTRGETPGLHSSRPSRPERAAVGPTGSILNHAALPHSVPDQDPPQHVSALSDSHTECRNSSVMIQEIIESVAPLDTKSPVAVSSIRINSPFSLTTMHDVFTTFGSEKRSLLDSIGLGGLLKVQKQRLQCRNLLLHLLSNMDPKTGTIKLKTGDLTMKDRDVNLVLGIPYGGQEVITSSRCPGVIEKLKDILLIDSESDITIESVQAILLRQYGRKMNSRERDAFKVAAMIFVDSCFLGPRGSNRTINKGILKNVAEPSEITKSNWSGYVLEVLKLSAYKVQRSLMAGNKTVLLEGCLLFLLVFYLDNLNFGYMTPRHDILPRISSYTPRLVSELLSYDRVSRPGHRTLQYGRSKIRPCHEVIYSRRAIEGTAGSHAQHKFGEPTMPNMKVNSFQTLSTTENEQDQLHGHLNILGAEATIEEYLQTFTNQMQRSTDELRQKLVNFVKNYAHNASSSSASKAVSDHQINFDDHTGNSKKLGPKAPSRMYYMTVISSSSGSINNEKTSEIPNVDVNSLVHGQTVLDSDSRTVQPPNLPLPSDCTDEGSKCQSITELQSTKLCGVSEATPVCNQFVDEYLFPPSPFELKLKHPDIPLKTIMEVIRLLPKITNDEKTMSWYVHDVPARLEIMGESLYLTLYKEVDFSNDIMTAVIRLYQELDDDMYQHSSKNRWRHYVPPQWVDLAMLSQETTVTRQMNKIFCGEHIMYNVHECAMVFVPVYSAPKWALYSWDFRTRTITVIDPVDKSDDILHAKHHSTICYLHEAMLYCKQEFPRCSDNELNKWSHKYLSEIDDCSTFSRSGLYTLFYARFFDGSTCTQTMLMEDSVTLFQTSVLCQLLRSSRNKGTYPQAIHDAISDII